MREQWAQFPPLPVMVAHHLGAAKPRTAAQTVQHLEEQNYIPAKALPGAEFDALVQGMGLRPASPPPTTSTP